MCTTCGCSDTDGVTITDLATGEKRVLTQAGHDRVHAHGMAHEYHHETGEPGGDHQHALVYRPVREHGHQGLHGRDHGHEHAHPHGHDHAHEHDHRHPHDPEHPGDHEHPHDHEHPGDHEHPRDHEYPRDHEQRTSGVMTLHARLHGTTIALEQEILAKNQRLAERNRGWFAGRGILALNLVSSPGSGKTTLLERTIRDLEGKIDIQVIEGDQATVNDAERIRATGCRVIQINTGTGCHLEADMLARGLAQLNPPPDSVLMIENVGNLVCPALFDLGEQAKVVILSVTEGEDKPIKYPHMFKASQVMLLNKIDLLPHLRFDVERCVAYARQVNPAIQIFRVSAETGEGMDGWYGWLRGQRPGREDFGDREDFGGRA